MSQTLLLAKTTCHTRPLPQLGRAGEGSAISPEIASKGACGLARIPFGTMPEILS